VNLPLDKPHSHDCAWFKCDHCEHLHVILRDEAGEPIATAVVDREMLLDMLKTIDGLPTMEVSH